MHSFDEPIPRLVLTAVVTEETEGILKSFAKKKKKRMAYVFVKCLHKIFFKLSSTCNTHTPIRLTCILLMTCYWTNGFSNKNNITVA